MNLKLALLLTGLVTSTIYAADAAQDRDERGQSRVRVVFEDDNQTPTQMSDEQRMTLAIKKSLETTAAAETFRTKMAAHGNADRTPMGRVNFEALKRDVGDISGSADVNELQSMINRVREAQKSATLTDGQQDEIDVLLINLATRMSELSSAERLGAPAV
jgi:hypothetical protein